MGWKGLERDALDFILTDLMPVELSDRFSFYCLYEFLLTNNNRKFLSSITKELNKVKYQGKEKLFENEWASQPLKYKVVKGLGTYREMSLIQPFSALNLYLFIQCYQKEILQYFKKNHTFTIRYHKNNSDLSYKETCNKTTKYFLKSSQKLKKLVVQQAGNYFKIVPFTSLNSFTDSHAWRLNNFKFKYFAKIDYKSCFDSIYSHAFSYIIEPNLIDAKSAKNSNLFLEIDRILQNINGRSSNGLIVGPEFSRMIAEILLEHIDSEVIYALADKGITYKKDYRVFRYVDDIFIFTNNTHVSDLVISTFQSVASKFRLSINELKIIKGETPCLPKDWLEKSRLISDAISGIFFVGKFNDFQKLPETDKHFVSKLSSVERIKDEVTVLMKTYPSDRRTIVSFLLSTLLHKLSKCTEGYQLFKTKSCVSHALKILDLVLFIYAFFPAFEQSEKVISILTYIDKEADFCGLKEKDSGEKINKLNRLFEKYSFIFQEGNLHDLCDWFPCFFEKHIKLSTACESIVLKKAIEVNDPIVFANLLIYSSYNKKLNSEWIKQIEAIIKRNLDQLGKENLVEYRSFWFILVFFNCPYLSPEIKKELEYQINVLDKYWSQKPATAHNAKIHRLLCKFLLNNLSNKVGFFDWSNVKRFGERITYRTYKRTFFKRYKKKSYGLYVSLE